MAYIVTDYIVMAYIVMAYIVMAYMAWPMAYRQRSKHLHTVPGIVTGRIGSRQHLAENVWLVSWGVLEVPSSVVGTIYTRSNVGSTETIYFEKLANFPSVHVEIG